MEKLTPKDNIRKICATHSYIKRLKTTMQAGYNSETVIKERQSTFFVKCLKAVKELISGQLIQSKRQK